MDEVILRALERLLAVVIGGLCVYLGYRLFLCISEQKEGEGKIEFPGGASIFVTRVGSGVFFAMFGAAIVGLSLYKGIVASHPGPGGPWGYSGITQAAPAQAHEALERERLKLRLQVEFLNVLPTLLKRDLSDSDDREVATRSRDIKLLLMERVWGPDWGNLEEFRLWIEFGAPDPAPQKLSAPAQYLRAGQETSR
jgi:hypothetical protein